MYICIFVSIYVNVYACTYNSKKTLCRFARGPQFDLQLFRCWGRVFFGLQLFRCILKTSLDTKFSSELTYISSHAWTSRGRHMNESHNTHEKSTPTAWVLFTWKIHATDMNESHITHERVTHHTWTIHAAHMNISRHTHIGRESAFWRGGARLGFVVRWLLHVCRLHEL